MESWVAGREKCQDRSSRSYLSHYLNCPCLRVLFSLLVANAAACVDFSS